MKKRLTGIKKKLLDTGKRNRLTNFRRTVASTVEFVTDNIYELYDQMSLGKEFSLAKLFDDDLSDLYLDDDQKKKVTQSFSKIMPYKDKYDKNTILTIAKEIKNKENMLISTSHERVLLRTMNLLRQKSKLFYNENGINPLYLAFGFLNYKENNEEYSAPLVLIPVNILRPHPQDRPKIKIIDDDIFLNTNLIEKFYRDYNIKLNVEVTDLKSYLTYVKSSVFRHSFTVTEEVYLGIFSFSKITMYQDVVNYENLIQKSDIVKAFFSLDNNLNKNVKLEDVNLDDVLDDTNQVLYADSSQYKSIYWAKKGLSFVLQGPPGTGKSQTITNIIAELIAMNKRVLFICEKRSALEVVYRNLKKRDLGDYALPLFDTNLNKKEVVSNIYKNLDLIQEKRIIVSKHAKEILKDANLNNLELKDYFKILTDPILPLKKSLYELTSWIGDEEDLLHASFKDILTTTEDELDKIIKEVANFALAFKSLNTKVIDHPFYLFNRNRLSLQESNDLKTAISKAYADLDIFIKELKKLNNKLNLGYSDIKDFNLVLDLITSLGDIVKINCNYFQYDTQKILERINSLEKIYTLNDAIKKELMSKYKASFLDLDEELMLKELEQMTSKLKRFFSYKSFLKKYDDCLNNSFKPSFEELVADLGKLKEFKSNYYEAVKLEAPFKDKFNEYQGAKTSFISFKKMLELVLLVNKTKDYLNTNIETLISILNNEENEVYLKAKKEQVAKLYRNVLASLEVLNEYFDYDLTRENPDILLTKLKIAYLNFDCVYDYVNFTARYTQIGDKLSEIKKEFLQIEPAKILKMFKHHFALLFIDNYLKDKAELEVFSNQYLTTILNQYQENDNKSLDIAISKIKESITASWPQINGLMADNLEVKTLVEEANKKRKLKSLRTLFKEIPSILTDLKPIIMATPLTLATYIDPEAYQFDCVIFDEASQLTLENALGAMYRSKQVIIVGDNEQLPPTSFFDMVGQEDDDEDYNVYESLLDEAIVTLPKIMLKWHYRSKDESLIKFSNQEIYHDLTSFPSSEKRADFGINLEYVSDAIYYHGTRVNPFEAKRVIEVLEEIIKETPNRSVGIVTFNMAMQEYIERLVDKLRFTHKEYEPFFQEDKIESFFVKNLETVQGDERDVIILATTFGYDENRKLSFNFGPINKEGGYRRLNVAITRAKEEIIVVTSLKASDFNQTKSTNRGVLMLKNYLAFAEVSKNLTYQGQGTNDEVINSLQTYLNELGYKTITNLGLSDYKIDLAVLDKANQKFKLAILTDGINYQNLQTFKDRNHLIDEVLKMRGWKIYHVWSLAYLRQKEIIKKEILDMLVSEETNPTNYLDSIPKVEASYEVDDVVEVNSVDALFIKYPDVKGFIQNLDGSHLVTTNISKVIDLLLPVSIKELKKLILPLYGKSRMTPPLSKQIDNDIDFVIEKNNYKKMIGFIVKTDFGYTYDFRKYQEGYYYPPIDAIYIEELENAVIQILNKVKCTNKKILYKTLNELLGYSKSSAQTTAVFDHVIETMSDLGDLVLENDVISIE